MSNLAQVTPMLHVPALAAALEFFTGVLGFTVRFRMTNYAYLDREGVGMRILEEPGRLPVRMEDSRTTVYFDARDVDALYAEFRLRLETLPPDDVQGPVDQHWGQRELLLRMPDGHWLAFGQPVRRK